MCKEKNIFCNHVQKIFLKFLKKIWQHQKNKFIFAVQKIIKQQTMSRIQLHIENANWFSPKGYDTNAGACYAVE